MDTLGLHSFSEKTMGISAVPAEIQKKNDPINKIDTKKQNTQSIDNQPYNESGNPEKVKIAVNSLNNTLDSFSKSYQFKYLEDAERFQVSIVDRNTGEVVKEIPSEEVIQLAEKVHETINVLIDKYS